MFYLVNDRCVTNGTKLREISITEYQQTWAKVGENAMLKMLNLVPFYCVRRISPDF